MEEKYLWYWISLLKSKEVSSLKKLMREYKEPINFFEAKQEEYKKNISTREYEIIKASKDYEDIVKSYDNLKKIGVKYLSCTDAEYPLRLHNIPDKPYGIFYKGSLPRKDKLSIGIIGARKASMYGRENAYKFGKRLSEAGVSIISGLAMGIDGNAHMGAIKAKGYTLGVLGGGIDNIYPKENHALYESMENTGGIVSEFSPGTKPIGRFFPMRNRIISGFSDGILVIEAKKKSGSLITVDQGLEQGKDIYAIPGRISDTLSEGCNEIIRQGATLITSAEEIIDEYSDKFDMCKISNKKKAEEKLLANEEKIVYSCLRLEPKHLDNIVIETNISLKDMITILFLMENKGLIRQVSRNIYTIVDEC